MLSFCPTCANLLMVVNDGASRVRFACQTCPYIFLVEQKVGGAPPSDVSSSGCSTSSHRSSIIP